MRFRAAWAAFLLVGIVAVYGIRQIDVVDGHYLIDSNDYWQVRGRTPFHNPQMENGLMDRTVHRRSVRDASNQRKGQGTGQAAFRGGRYFNISLNSFDGDRDRNSHSLFISGEQNDALAQSDDRWRNGIVYQRRLSSDLVFKSSDSQLRGNEHLYRGGAPRIFEQKPYPDNESSIAPSGVCSSGWGCRYPRPLLGYDRFIADFISFPSRFRLSVDGGDGPLKFLGLFVGTFGKAFGFSPQANGRNGQNESEYADDESRNGADVVSIGVDERPDPTRDPDDHALTGGIVFLAGLAIYGLAGAWAFSRYNPQRKKRCQNKKRH